MALTYNQDLTIRKNRLKTTLLQTYDSVKRDVAINKNNIAAWEFARRLHETGVDDAIKSAVQEMYILAARKTIEKDIGFMDFFLTQRDMLAIADLTRRFQAWFWHGLQNEIQHQTAFHYDPKTLLYIPPSEVTLRKTFIGRLIGSIQSEVTSTAVVSKARQVAIDQAYTYTQRTTMGSSKVYGFRKGALRNKHRESNMYTYPQIVWKTGGKSELTCSTCKQYNNKTFEITDLAMPMPVINTHPNCECELVLVGV